MEAATLTEEQIREIARRIGEQPGVVQVWVFGSVANGTAGPDSDLDLLAVLEDSPDALAQMGELDDLFPRRLFAMDIVVLGLEDFQRSSSVPGALAYEVSRRGRLLHDRTH